ncbi:uncharacterized protein LOC142796322 isoform X3 [Rhipicephalus microplus]|uniref:uncharacterized protein LOC142796322 isoform X3 n=1 Tax=Rhipicephalus microplus TaxID=6941 RepID=UPI003F6C042E
MMPHLDRASHASRRSCQALLVDSDSLLIASLTSLVHLRGRRRSSGRGCGRDARRPQSSCGVSFSFRTRAS